MLCCFHENVCKNVLNKSYFSEKLNEKMFFKAPPGTQPTATQPPTMVPYSQGYNYNYNYNNQGYNYAYQQTTAGYRNVSSNSKSLQI